MQVVGWKLTWPKLLENITKTISILEGREYNKVKLAFVSNATSSMLLHSSPCTNCISTSTATCTDSEYQSIFISSYALDFFLFSQFITPFSFFVFSFFHILFSHFLFSLSFFSFLLFVVYVKIFSTKGKS